VRGILSIVRIVRSEVAFAPIPWPSVGFLGGNVGSVSGFLEEPDISFANRIICLGRKCRECRVFLAGERRQEFEQLFSCAREAVRAGVHFGLHLDSKT